MKRREFIKLSLITSSALFLPQWSYAKNFNINQIDFSNSIYNQNKAQTLIIFMYGGASQLAGNLTNIKEIKKASENSYDYFRGLTKTENNCWQEAGGTHMEELISNGDMTIFRTCFSQVREDNDNKAHGVCTAQNQKGSFAEDSAGIIANLAQILASNKIIDENTIMPFVTLDGESTFYTEGTTPLAGYLKPVGITENLDNPYKRDIRKWFYYSEAERALDPEHYSDDIDGFDPAIDAEMEKLAKKNNQNTEIKNAFAKRASMSSFIDNIANSTLPDLGDNEYPKHNDFAKKVETAIKVLVKNSDTKIVTLGTGGLGGWDDHNDARNYVERMENLFKTLKSAMAHIKAENREENINIIVFGEFGRNVNLNSANGWDHGNLQNLYILGGKGYFNHKGVVGETILDKTGQINRLFLKPKKGSYWFEPMSIASTIYKIYGIENPKILTGGYSPINIL
ncbi:MAG: DUF1501 domain-containing protein [Epsilonproteobacteria bacterium]|nr:DUF1501 domain-containing protein [Campylobacterota bacterium]